ncbi:MAG: hypothetical protein KAH24_07560 [Holophagae bacterium]|nr:hypothetical protein [Holophagae bacterium]
MVRYLGLVLFIFLLGETPILRASETNTVHLSFPWENKTQWSLYEHQDMAWGFAETVYLKAESWNSWTSKIQYTFNKETKLEQVVPGLKNLETRMKDMYPNVKSKDVSNDILKRKGAVVFLVESGEVEGRKPQSVLSLVVGCDGGVLVFQFVQKSAKMSAAACKNWMARFSSMELVHKSLFDYDMTTLEGVFEKYQVDMVILKKTTMLDEHPVWFPDSQHLAVNIGGKWISLNLNSLHALSARWKGQEVGLVDTVESCDVDGEQVEKWAAKENFGGRILKLQSGKELTLNSEGLAVSLELRSPDGTTRVYWQGSMENCHSLAASPDEQFVAFIAEQTGLIVLRIVKSLK